VSEARRLMTGFARLARELDAAPDEDARIRIAVSSAVLMVSGCDHAAFTPDDGGTFSAGGDSDDLGDGSMMSLLVRTRRRSYGALTLYADQHHRFDGEDVAVGQALAAQLAATIDAGRHLDQLRLAMDSRTTIGQAQGLLMGHLGIDAGQAFDYLRRISSQSNRKLSAVAVEIVRTRQLPSRPREVGSVAS
jgi:hypothetical protein